MFWVWFFLAFLVSVSLHELGHYLMARRYGVTPPVFAVGFGPVLLAHKVVFADGASTEFRLCALPLGGYVRIPTRHDCDPERHLERGIGKWVFYLLAPIRYVLSFLTPASRDDEDEEGQEVELACLDEKGAKAEFAVSVAGPLVNIGLALALLWTSFLTMGVHPKVLEFAGEKFGLALSDGFLSALLVPVLMVAVIVLFMWVATAMVPFIVFSFSGENATHGNFHALLNLKEMALNGMASLGGTPLENIVLIFALWNLLLAGFNLFPLPGLDGGGIALAMARKRLSPERFTLIKEYYLIGAAVCVGGLLTAFLLKDVIFLVVKLGGVFT